MTKTAKLLKWTVIAAAVLVVAYIAIGSWQAASLLDATLRVGAPTAQSSGWPAPQSPADIGYEGDPQQAYGYTFQDVELSGELGDLAAWLIPASQENATAPWAIFVHGIGGRRENGYRFLPTFHEAGLPVLMISYRNDSNQPADPSGLYAFGLTEWRDLETAVQFAMENGAPSIIVVAESMGGGIVGQFLRQSDTAASLSAIVLDAPAIDFHAILTDQIERMDLPLAPILALGALWFSGLSEPVHLADALTTDEFAAFGEPIFLSHGFSDSVVPIGSSDALVGRREHVTQYLQTGSDHIQSWKADPARYEAALKGFSHNAQGARLARTNSLVAAGPYVTSSEHFGHFHL
ncbi:alpha/beta hydrolase [Pelagibacterium sp. H642]|uniref:alpha/beta hydrolase n=1 Tax=Pelagibacterium sp. H642 TaxID=1881069 RepID=UPI002816585D|nr:alpha/beta hydrolase [Pelagibacterium sp. H642]WMT89371.1 alpha/beta hydrolase [Pelagibacterium sp. H642]